jgi:signal transduction histidine kinase
LVRIHLISKRLRNVFRQELVSVLVPSALAGFTIFGFMILREAFPAWISKDAGVMVAATLVAGVCYAICSKKIFDARFFLRRALKYFAVAICVGISSSSLHALLLTLLPTWLLFGVMGVGAVGVYAAVEPLLERWLFRRPSLEAARASLHRVARTCLAEAQLVDEAANVLGEWADSSFHIITPTPEPPSYALIHLKPEDPVIADLRAARWITPERLHREPHTAAHERLVRFLSQNLLSVAVISEGSDPPVILAAQRRSSLRPFTYPEIKNLLEFSAIIQLALARVRLVQAAMHADRLSVVGIVGATLAHEIRNPLHAIRTFAEMLPSHYERPDFRHQFSQTIGHEVSRIDHLVSQLAQMASPRRPSLAPANFNEVVEASLDLVRLSLERKGIAIEAHLHADPSPFSTDATLVRQVILNLCLNAGHALADQSGPRWIRVSTASSDDGIRLTVSDNGPGLPSAVQARLFQRFVSLSDRGLGLGLTICREAMLSLGGSLQYDAASSAASGGTVFHAGFPFPADSDPAADSADVAPFSLAPSSHSAARAIAARVPDPVAAQVGA